MNWLRLCLAGWVAFTLVTTKSSGADRVALVIGNGRYEHLPQLEACPRAAAKMAEVFAKIGIRVHGGKPLMDLTTGQMGRTIDEFARSLTKDSEVFVYYSGHGLQLDGNNYLLPVDFNAQFTSQARQQAVSLNSILELLRKTEAKARVVILDASRDPGNVLYGEPKELLANRNGLSDPRVDAPQTIVCFAAKHGDSSVADGADSLYTSVLAEEMVKPGKIEDVMKAVARRVSAATGSRQIPSIYGRLQGDYTFVNLGSAAGPDGASPLGPGGIPYARPVPNRPGFVFSPYDQYKGYIDVRGFPADTEVKDPYSGKSFLVPKF